MSYIYFKNFHKVDYDDASSMIFNCCTENNEVLFAYIESNLEEESEGNKHFINTNQMIVSDEWIFPGENLGYVNNIVWYRTKTEVEIKRAMQIDNFFRCIILPKDAALAQFDYLMFMIEDDDSPVLCVYDQKTDFRDSVLPKIKCYFKESNIKT
ncbi:hypothetical protein [Paenibacillus tundrae]|uniref:hypothetical protein n=1 Tax=Paenibacillus tundrae TaxID=528187 RepID=UPI0030D57CA4